MNGPTLVTGAGGFLGGHVVAALAARGEAGRALDMAVRAALAAGEGVVATQLVLRAGLART